LSKKISVLDLIDLNFNSKIYTHLSALTATKLSSQHFAPKLISIASLISFSPRMKMEIQYFCSTSVVSSKLQSKAQTYYNTEGPSRALAVFLIFLSLYP
jgi:hypothetical protein